MEQHIHLIRRIGIRKRHRRIQRLRWGSIPDKRRRRIRVRPMRARRWYCMEAYWLEDGSNGKATLWIDGAQAISITGRNTGYYGDVNQVRFGIAEVYNAAYTKVYGDTVKVSNKYTGPA